MIASPALAGQSSAVDGEGSAIARTLGFDRAHVKLSPDEVTLRLSGPSSITVAMPENVAAAIASRLAPVLGLGRDDALVATTKSSYQGRDGYRLEQTWRGLPVVGSGLVVQADSAGRVISVSGRVRRGLDLDTSRVSAPESVIAAAVGDTFGKAFVNEAGFRWEMHRKPELVVYAARGHQPTLAWSTVLEGRSKDNFDLRLVVVAADSARVLASSTLVWSLERRVHDAEGGCLAALFGVELPGPQTMGEGDTSTDPQAQAAYDNTGVTYWFYWHFFGRDSWDDEGIPLVSTVHLTFSTSIFPVSCSPNNAAFLPSPYNQMVYGDGDGDILLPLAEAIDVTAHELTHGVTSSTSNLTYQQESGAINEAMSDIFAAGAEAWKASLDAEGRDPASGNPTHFQTYPETWLVGEEVAGPSLGQALRYMHDPALDNQSADYYPDRNYADCTSPSQENDQCGVHTNSGIGNLAFYLLVEGGTHPRGKTSTEVPGIGIASALSIFYEANTQLVTEDATWEDLRWATGTAAENQFGSSSCEWVAVMKAWDAVGVNGAWTDPGNCGSGSQEPPVASFSFSADSLDVSFDGTASSDPDGYIVDWAWSFGDGTSGSGATVQHHYAAEGNYTVTLTVTDDSDLTASTSQTIPVTSSLDPQPPVASFSFSADNLDISFDGTASSDPDGHIIDWAWSFGDGTSGSGATVQHQFPADGNYTVRLTVTDDTGLTASTSQIIPVTASPGGDDPCTACDHYSGTLSGSFDADDHPDGTYYHSGSGTHHGWLEGPAGTDFDLYLYKWGWFGWRVVASSTSSSSSEEVVYNGSSGYYIWQVMSYSGSGDYDLWLDLPNDVMFERP